MRLGSWRFRAALVPSLAALAMLILFVSLGFWQLGRVAEKRELLQRDALRAAEPPVRLAPDAVTGGSGDIDALRFRRVILHGSFLPARQYLLDNRTHRGAAGYHVLTPFLRARGGALLLVDRGWVPVGESRDRLPDVGLTSAPVRVTATLADPPRAGLLLGETGYDGDSWPRVVQHVDLELIAAQLEAPVLPLVARLDADAPQGFVREWGPYYGISPDRHLGYAVQWFALATALVVLYLCLTFKRGAVDERD